MQKYNKFAKNASLHPNLLYIIGEKTSKIAYKNRPRFVRDARTTRP